MATFYERNPSLWIATTDEYSAPPLTAGDVMVDVAVIGGGITGLLVARSLAAEGARVAVIEAARIASVTTGYTTAKITSLHGLIYAELITKHGEEKARMYAEANQTAVERFASLVEEADIDCDFRRMAAYTYTESADLRGSVEAEVEACQSLGLAATFQQSSSLPFPIEAAIMLEGQGLFHPRKFCLAVADFLLKDGHAIYEMTRALDVEEGTPCVVTTNRGSLRADNVVIA